MLKVNPHTAPRVAAQEGQSIAAKLLWRSGWPWLGTLAAAALIAGSALQISGFDAKATGSIGALLLVLVVFGGAVFADARSMARLFLFLSALALGLSFAALDHYALGATLFASTSLLVSEALVQLLRWRDRESWAITFSLVLPALIASVGVYFVPPSLTSPLGAGLGAGAAIIVSALARLGEQALACRHGAEQTSQAALTRLSEVGRVLILALTSDSLASDSLASDALASHEGETLTTAEREAMAPGDAVNGRLAAYGRTVQSRGGSISPGATT